MYHSSVTGMRGLLVLFMIMTACAGPGGKTDPKLNARIVSQAVIPVPSPFFLSDVKTTCGERSDTQFRKCLLTRMKTAGFPKQAGTFIEMTGRAGFVLEYIPCGAVAVADVYEPFDPVNPWSVLLVSGTSGIQRMDDPALFPMEEMKKGAVYQHLRGEYPSIRLRRPVRMTHESLSVEKTGDGGHRFTAHYPLCREKGKGAMVGSARFSFYYDQRGGFKGCRFMEMSPEMEGFIHHPFTLTLESNVDDESEWQMFRPPDSSILKLKSKETLLITSGVSGSSSKDVWTFEAVGEGDTWVHMNYVRPSGKGIPSKNAVFQVRILPSIEDLQRIHQDAFMEAVNDFLKDIESPMAGRIRVRLVAMEKGHARVVIQPIEKESRKLATGFLRRENGKWVVFSVGEFYGPGFFEKHDIPKTLRTGTGIRKTFHPPPLSMCQKLGETVGLALKGDALLREKVSFKDPNTNNSGLGCQTLVKVPDSGIAPDALMDRIRRILIIEGWEEDAGYQEKTPLGLSTGFRKKDILLLLNVMEDQSGERIPSGKTRQEETGVMTTLEDLHYIVTITCAVPE